MELHRRPDLHLDIGREEGGLVNVALDEIAALIKVLNEAAADLAVEAGGDLPDDIDLPFLAKMAIRA